MGLRQLSRPARGLGKRPKVGEQMAAHWMPWSVTRYIGGVADNLILITLLVKLGVVASVASVLARVTTFRRLFFAEKRSSRQTLALLAFIVVPLTLGVWVRTAVPNFLAADISFEIGRASCRERAYIQEVPV